MTVLTDAITLKPNEERIQLYCKYQQIVHKETRNVNTYNDNWVTAGTAIVATDL